MKSLVKILLKLRARNVVKTHKPMIIGVTGTVGKTSTKHAIYTCVRKFRVTRESPKNYNNELGVPLAVLGKESGGHSAAKWVDALAGSPESEGKEYPELLILEMAVDRPGDLDYLLSIVRPTFGVLTAITPAHLEFFNDDIDELAREKRKLLEALPPEGRAIINGDDPLVVEAAQHIKAKVVSYGLSEDVMVRALDVRPIIDTATGVISGIGFKVRCEGAIVPFFMPHAVGEFQIYAALAGIACALQLGINPIEIAEALRESTPLPGRMNVIEGIKRTTLLDDTYNASPAALTVALEVLENVPATGRKVAVLGDMLELGRASEQEHHRAGERVAKSAELLITCGERARDIARGARDAGLHEGFIYSVATPEEAGILLQERMREGDVILIKGSQGARMEKVVKEVMAHPDRAQELLVRQGKEWR